MILSLLEDWDRAFDQTVIAAKEGKAIIYPTDTSYAIGGNALDGKAIERIRGIAKTENPIPVIVANLEMLIKHFDLDDAERKFITQCCPGPYAFILKPKARMPVEDKNGNVLVRIPNHIFIRKVCFELGKPMACESLNGEVSEFSKIGKEIVETADVAIDSGTKLPGKEPTVVNIRERKIERQGAGEFSFE